MCALNCKFFDGISEENINKAIKQLKSEGNTIIGKPEFSYLDNKFIIFYKEKDKTTPLEEDIKKHVYSHLGEQEIVGLQPEQPNPSGWRFLLRKYWQAPALVVLAVIYYILFYLL